MRGLLNVDRGFFSCGNDLGFPELDPVTDPISEVDWFSFQDRASVSVFGSSGLHFYCQDFTFEVLWNQPSRNLDKLKMFKYVIQPDFSLYYDFPVVVQMFNKYRNHWLGKYFSFHGVNIIPNVNISTPDCWDWSFIGLPQKSVVAWSDVGSYQDKEDRAVLFAGYDEMIKRLDPIQILYFTRNPDNAPSECLPIVIPFRK